MIKIITLIDNTVYDKGLIAEHGFSLYIEVNNKKILFDTGQSKNFIHNAEILGVDLSEIDFCIISHGHYDHTGGLEEFCRINKKAVIFIKKDALTGKFNINKENVGIPFDAKIISSRFAFVDKKIYLTDDIVIVPEIKIYNEYDTHFNNLFEKKGEEYITDEFYDEQFVAVRNNDALVIISGCSHRGITNITGTAIKELNLPVELVLGGFHLKDEKEADIVKIIEELNKYAIKRIGLSHCTGVETISVLSKKYKGEIFYNYTGKVIKF